MKYIVECFNDNCLLEAFGVNSNLEIDHNYLQGKGTVLNKLSKQKNKIGVIDFDKGIKHRYFEKCTLLPPISHDITIFYENVNKNYIIVFRPKIEAIFVRITRQTLSVETAKKLGFDNTSVNYHNVRSDKQKLSNLRNLLKTLIKRSKELQTLKNYLI